MARPREFDIDAAVTRAMGVFWTYGYDGTTTDQLLQGMQLTRGSLYKAFGDKKQLFLKSLDLYDQSEVDKAALALRSPEMPGTERIRQLFSSIADTVEAGNRMGCLLCTTLSGLSSSDPDLASRTLVSVEKLRSGFEAALTDTDKDAYPPDYAQLLLTQYVGLRMLSRAPVRASVIRESVDAVSALLERG